MVKKIAYSLMDEGQVPQFERNLELNMALAVKEAGRFRINVFKQRGEVGMVIRAIKSEIPSIEQLQLPSIFRDLIMEPRGLILVVGATGSGKSTTLAAMIDHRNTHSPGHILTIEDPIEYLHRHKKSIVNQREVGLDTHSYARGAEERDARGAGRDHDRRDPRHRHDGGGDRLLRNRPPVPGDAALQQRRPDAGAHPQLLPRVGAQERADEPVAEPARGDQPAPGDRQGRPPHAGRPRCC